MKSRPPCPRCATPFPHKWGSADGLQRFRCKTCGTTYNVLSGSGAARLRHRQTKWHYHLDATARGLSIRAAAVACGIAPSTALRWRRRLDPVAVRRAAANDNNRQITCIDLFAGIGGLSLPFRELGVEPVFASEIDPAARKAYEANYGEFPSGDITKIDAADIPDHDILLAGFPCQAFSICGIGAGFEDTRGTLFFEVARILEAKRPSGFVLENVPRLVSHDGGRTMDIILSVLCNLGYETEWRILDAMDFGLPHSRKRIFIVGRLPGGRFDTLSWPEGDVPMRPLEDLLDDDDEVDARHFASPRIIAARRSSHSPPDDRRRIWHENKSGIISSHRHSCALRAEASFNYLLVDGIRRLTPREYARLMGYPEDWAIPCSDTQAYRQFGNSVAVPVVRAIALAMLVGAAGSAVRKLAA